MVRNPIVLRVARTTLVWWLALSALTFTSFELIGHAANVHEIATRFLLAIAGLGAAVALAAAFTLTRRLLAQRRLVQGERRGLTTSIGPVPEGLGVPPRIPGSRLEIEPDHPLRRWASTVERDYPELHRLYTAIIETFAAYPDWPAAPVSTGHGGRSLFEHSLVVVEQASALAPGFRYDGGRNKQGNLVAPVLDPNFQFNPADPLILLIALVHDIGKAECYQRDPHTRAIDEVKADHDRVGRMMLARMPELWDLQRDDRQALLYAVGYYHHPQELPRFVDDRARALMELLIVADKAAGQFETAHPLWRADAANVAPRGSLAPPNQQAAASGAGASSLQASPFRPAPPPPSRSADVDRPTVRPEFAAAGLDALEIAYVEAFLALLALPEAINGELRKKLAWRWDDLLYFAEIPLRRALARQLGEPALAEQENGERRSQVTEDLMRALLKLGLLYHQHDGMTYSEKGSLFEVEYLMQRKDDHGDRAYNTVNKNHTSPATVIVKVAGPLARLVPAGNCKLMPRIVRPTMGEHRALNKKAVRTGLAKERAEIAATAPVTDRGHHVVERSDREASGSRETIVGSDGHADDASASVDAPGATGETRAQREQEARPPVLPPLPPATDAAAGSLLALVDAARNRQRDAVEPPPSTLSEAGSGSPDLRAEIEQVDGPSGWVLLDGARYRGRAISLERAASLAGLIAALEADSSGSFRVIRQPEAVLLLIRDAETPENDEKPTALTAAA